MSSLHLIQWLRRPFHEAADSTEAQRVEALQRAAAEEMPAEPSKTPLRWLANLVATIISGLGLGGVVSLIGAAIIWVRFDEAGLPATQALSVVPDGQLLIQGAAATLTGVLLGLLAVLVLFSIDRTGQVTNAAVLALALLWAGGVGWAILGTDLGFEAVVLLAVLGLILATASLGIGKVTGSRFVPFAMAVFGSAVIFGGGVSLAIAYQQDYIQPAAVLRSTDGQGLRGFYIGDNDEFIYLGVIRSSYIPDEPGDAVPMYRVPREAKTRLLVGKLEPFQRAVAQSNVLRRQLRETGTFGDPFPEEAANAPPAASAPAP